MKRVCLAVTVICVIGILTGCGKSAPEEAPQSFSNIGSSEFSEGIRATEQSDEIQRDVGENDVLSTDQKESERIQSEQIEGNRLE